MNPTYVAWEDVCRACGPRAVGMPPAAPGLFVCGSLEGLGRPSVAIVGTRAASRAGQSLTVQVSRELSRAGLCVISGLALGIDAAAHEGALAGGGPTIGILGGGHHRFFPPRNRALAERILQANGAVCSPYEPERAALPFQFLERNGVVAALADAVVVIEAPSRSGALNTAAWAAGRIPVLVFPGDVDRRSVSGCLALIRDGATLVRDATDILAELRLEAHVQPLPLQQVDALDHMEQQVAQALENEPLSTDQLIAHTGCGASAVLAALSRLELNGFVERGDGGMFARR